MIILTALSALSLSQAAEDVRTGPAARLGRLVEVATIDTACGLLAPGERAILEREIATARHQAEQDGMSAAVYSSGTARIQRRWTTPDCTSSETVFPVSRYRQALNGWLMGGERVFDGPSRSWTAGPPTIEGEAPWILAQDAVHGDLSARFGSVIIGTEPVVLLSLRSGQRPVSAVIVLRDVNLAPTPIDFTYGGRRQPPGGEPLAALGALSNGQQRIWTSGRLRDGGQFAPEGEGETASFIFPDETLERIAALDAAEAARVDLFDETGGRIGRVWIEAGGLRQAHDYALAANTPREPETRP